MIGSLLDSKKNKDSTAKAGHVSRDIWHKLWDMEELFKQHNQDIKAVQEQVKFFFSKKRKIKIYHGTTNTTRSLKFEKDNFVDISKLNRVMAIDKEEKFALVEPNVPMDKLVEETLKYDLIPPVVPEFPGITVGGAVQGGAEESSSFKYGMVHDNCLEYEIILGNGELITASPQKNLDLFNGIAASYGSLGIITSIKLKLIATRDYVQLTYQTVKSFEESVKLVKQKASETVNFIDGIMFSKNLGVVMTGNFVDRTDLPVSTFNKSTDEWFYLHADKISKKYTSYEELIPVKNYLFRYDRGAFWMTRYGFKIFKCPFNKLTRFIFNAVCNTRTSYRLLHEINLSQKYFIQDFNIPSKNVLKFLELVDEKLTIYPIWICPLRPGKYDALSANCIRTDLVFNIGIWGEVKKDFADFVALNRYFEQKSSELNGRKMLYAHSYYPPEDFWKVYDLEWYNALRKKYHADDTFLTIYEKTKVSEKYKPSILGGVWKYIKSPKILKIITKKINF